MNLVKTIRHDFKYAMKGKCVQLSNGYKYILSEISRLPHKEATDEEVMIILRKIRKNEEQLTGTPKSDKFLLDLVNEYLPKMAKEEDIKAAIEKVDLSKFKNKMQAMGAIMKQFPKGCVDGNLVKKLLLEGE